MRYVGVSTDGWAREVERKPIIHTPTSQKRERHMISHPSVFDIILYFRASVAL